MGKFKAKFQMEVEMDKRPIKGEITFPAINRLDAEAFLELVFKDDDRFFNVELYDADPTTINEQGPST